MVSGVEEDQEQLFRAIDAGARSFVNKGEAPDVIVEAVRGAAHGAAYLRPESVRLLLQRITGGASFGAPAVERDRAGDQRLTEREKDVLRLLAKGRRNSEIAEQMGLSMRAVGNHLAKIYNKLHVHGRSEAVRYAIKAGVVSLADS